MKKKISVAALLLSLLLVLAVPVQAKAEDNYGFIYNPDKVTIYDSLGNGYSIYSKLKTQIDAGWNILVFAIDDSSMDYSSLYVFAYDSKFTLASANGLNRAFFLLENGSFVPCNNDTGTYFCSVTYYGNGNNYTNGDKGNCDVSSTSTGYGSIEYWMRSNDLYVVYSSVDILNCKITNSTNMPELLDTYYYQKPVDLYTFDEWCSDAGLSCSASSNESSSVVPFFYEPDYYNYIVRKTLTASSTSGVYQVTVLQKSDGAHYPYYFEVNNLGYLGVAGSFTDTSTFTIRNFYYDAEGNGWKHIERFDVSTLPFDNTNVNFNDNVVFVYSDADIFSDRQASAVWQHASTEYFNVDIQDPEDPIPTPTLTPIPTPTIVPSSGSGTSPDIGGQVTGGGGLDFIINLFTMIWTKICSIPMAVDGYSISLQQLFVYGALVSIVGGFIIHFIFGRK